MFPVDLELLALSAIEIILTIGNPLIDCSVDIVPNEAHANGKFQLVN